MTDARLKHYGFALCRCQRWNVPVWPVATFRCNAAPTETRSFALPSFDAYFAPIEQGGGSPGQAFVPSLTQPAVPCARKYGVIFAIPADQSR
jgi:hypothetical protein